MKNSPEPLDCMNEFTLHVSNELPYLLVSSISERVVKTHFPPNEFYRVGQDQLFQCRSERPLTSV